jgi:hypothetical protein
MEELTNSTINIQAETINTYTPSIYMAVIKINQVGNIVNITNPHVINKYKMYINNSNINVGQNIYTYFNKPELTKYIMRYLESNKIHFNYELPLTNDRWMSFYFYRTSSVSNYAYCLISFNVVTDKNRLICISNELTYYIDTIKDINHLKTKLQINSNSVNNNTIKQEINTSAKGNCNQDYKSIKIKDKLNNIIMSHYFDIENKHVHIDIKNSDIILYTSEHIIDTVLNNIIYNAVKSSPVNGKIYIKTVFEYPHVYITIKYNNHFNNRKCYGNSLYDCNTINLSKKNDTDVFICQTMLDKIAGKINTKELNRENIVNLVLPIHYKLGNINVDTHNIVDI